MTPETRFLALIARHFGCIETAAREPLDALIVEDLRPDSLDIVELSMALEDEFDVALSDDELEPFDPAYNHTGKTLRDLFALLEAKIGERA